MLNGLSMFTKHFISIIIIIRLDSFLWNFHKYLFIVPTIILLNYFRRLATVTYINVLRVSRVLTLLYNTFKLLPISMKLLFLKPVGITSDIVYVSQLNGILRYSLYWPRTPFLWVVRLSSVSRVNTAYCSMC